MASSWSACWRWPTIERRSPRWSFNIDLPPRRPLLQTSFVCAADVSRGVRTGQRHRHLQRRGGPGQRHLDEVPDVAAATPCSPPRTATSSSTAASTPSASPGPLYNDLRGRGRPAGRLDDHPAVREERLPHLRAQHRPQGQGGGAGGEARAGAREGRDPRALPQHHLLRAGGLRRRRRRPGLLRQGRPGPRAAGGVLPRRADPLAGRRRRRWPAPRGGRPPARAPCSTPWSRRATSRGATRRPWTRRRSGRDVRRAARPHRASAPVEGDGHRHQVLRGGGAPPGRRDATARTRSTAAGLRIYTTLDLDMQRAAWDAVTSTLDQEGDPDGRARRGRRARPREGDGRRARLRRGRAQPRPRQERVRPRLGRDRPGAGSSFKPFVLAEAIRQGISLNSMFDAPGSMTFPGVPGAEVGEDWKVGNYGGTEQGVLDLVDATRVSSNTAYAQLMLEVGPAERGRPGRPAGRRRRAARGPVPRPRHRRRVAARHGRGLQHLRQPRGAQRPGDDRQGRAGRRRRRASTCSTRPCRRGERVLTEEQADQVTYCLRGGRRGRHRHRGRIGKPAAGQDGHHAGQQRRLVRRLHARAHRRGVDGLRRPAARRHRPHHGRRVIGRPAPRPEGSPAAPSRPRSGTSSCGRPPRATSAASFDDARPRSPGRSSTSGSSPTTTTDGDVVRRAPRRRRAPPRPRVDDTTTTSSTTSSDHDRRTAPTTTTTQPHRTDGRTPVGSVPRGSDSSRAGSGAAGEAPALDVVEHLDLLLLVPRRRGEVDAVHGHDLDALVAAAVAPPHLVHRRGGYRRPE